MAAKKRINGLIDEEVVNGVFKAADEDGRSASSLMEKILRAWLIEKGYIKSKKP